MEEKGGRWRIKNHKKTCSICGGFPDERFPHGGHQEVVLLRGSSWKCATNLDDLMKVTKRSLLTMAAVVLVVVVLIIRTARDKAKQGTPDDKHRDLNGPFTGGDLSFSEYGHLATQHDEKIGRQGGNG